MCAGDHVSLYDTSVVMIHKGWAQVKDRAMNSDDFQLAARQLAASDQSMAGIYAKKTGRSPDEILQAMKEETWLVGQEAVDYGLCDEVIDGATIYAESLMEVKAMAKEMENVEAKDLAPVADEVTEKVEEPKPKKEKEAPKAEPEKPAPAKKEPVKAEAPVSDEAINALAELERMKALDDFAIEAKVDPAIIHKAKYEDKITAKDLAYQLCVDRAKMETVSASAYKADQLESGANDVPAGTTDPIGNVNAKDKFPSWTEIAEYMENLK